MRILNAALGLGLLLVIGTLMFNAAFTGHVVVDPFQDENISLALSYRSGTVWDADDDGIENVTGAIDLTAADTNFIWNASENHLCTLWDVIAHDLNTTTRTCFGAEECCTFAGLDPYEEEWDTSLDLTYDRFGAGLNNTVRSQVLFVNFSLDPENPYADVRMSSQDTLSAVFLNESEEGEPPEEESGYDTSSAPNPAACGSDLNDGTFWASDLTATGDCLTFVEDNVNLNCAGGSITGNGSGRAFVNNGFGRATIRNCVLRNFSYGFWINTSVNVTLINISILDTTYPAFLNGSHLRFLNGSVNGGEKGIWVGGPGNSNSLIEGNVIWNTSIGILVESERNETIRNNTIFNATFSILVNRSKNISVDSNNIFDSDRGIIFQLTNESSIVGNRVNGSSEGIRLTNVSITTVESNTINLTTTGIAMTGSLLNVITGNSMYYSMFGINTDDDFNNFSFNRIFHQDKGLVVSTSHNNTFVNNTIFNSTQEGIYSFDSMDNLYVNNTIMLSLDGISFDRFSFSGTNNLVHHNFFYNSSRWQAISKLAGNDFNTSVGGVAQGNFWDDIVVHDLAIVDTNSDGYADAGFDYPYNSSNGGNVTENVTDWGPIVSSNISCGLDLTSSVTLTQAVSSSGRCFTISTPGVILNCAGNRINYDSSGSGANAIDVFNTKNISIRNCLIYDVNSGGSFGIGINLTNVHNSSLIENTIQTNGTFRNYPILWEHGKGNLITGNVLRSLGTTSANHALYLIRHVNFTNVAGNIVSSVGSSINFGIYLRYSNWNNVTNNEVNTTVPTGGSNYGITLESNSTHNRVETNTAYSRGNGLFVLAEAHNNTFSGNTIVTLGSSDGIDLDESLENTFVNNRIRVESSTSLGIDVADSNMSNFTGNTITTPSNWIDVDDSFNATFSQTAFNDTLGQLYYPGMFIVNGSQLFSRVLVNVSNASAFVNSSSLGILNQSAQLTLREISNSNPTVEVDFEDDGTFINCSAPQCVNISFSSGIFVFNVSHFTTYQVPQEPAAAGGAPVAGGGGGAGRQGGFPGAPPAQEEPPAEEPEEIEEGEQEESEEVEEEAQTEQPAALGPVDEELGIDPALVNVAEVACVSRQNGESTEIVHPELDYSAPFGWDILAEPFAVDCSEGSFEATLNIPLVYDTVEALKCTTDGCAPFTVTPTSTVVCPGNSGELLREDDEYTPGAISLEGTTITVGDIVPVIGDVYNAETLLGDPIDASWQLAEDAMQPSNKRSKLIGFVVELIPGETTGEIRVQLPFVADPAVATESIGIFYYKDGGWRPLDSIRDLNTIRATLSIESTLEDGRVQLATIGTLCDECELTSFEQVYHPLEGSSAAVILVHGLGSSPATFQKIIDDIRITRQPWQAWTFAYPENASTEEIGKVLADEVEKHADEYDVIYFVAHSLGGIITHEGLAYAHSEHELDESRYTFISDVRKVISVASPNEPVESETVLSLLFDYLMNVQATGKLFTPQSELVSDLKKGSSAPQVPGVTYYVIAGTTPYTFYSSGVEIQSDSLLGLSGTNDGLVSAMSAQLIGGEFINDQCLNYWEVPGTHTSILQEDDTRVLVEKIVAEELRKELRDEALIGNNRYYTISSTCDSGDTYVVIGKKKTLKPLNQYDVYGCACGDNVCGLGEDTVNCPSDCLFLFKKPGNIPIIGVLAFIIVLLFIAFAHRHIRNHIKELFRWHIYPELILESALIALVVSDIILTRKDFGPLVLNISIVTLLVWRIWTVLHEYRKLVDQVLTEVARSGKSADELGPEALSEIIKQAEHDVYSREGPIQRVLSSVKEWFKRPPVLLFILLIIVVGALLLIGSVDVGPTAASVVHP